MAFPPSLLTIAILANKAYYSASLFVARKPKCKDFSIINFSGITNIIPTLEPFWFAAPSVYTSQITVEEAEATKTLDPSLLSSPTSSVNFATKSAKTCPFTVVRGRYLISKDLSIVSHLAILPV